MEWAERFGLQDVPVLSVDEEDLLYPDGEGWTYDHNMGVGTITHLGPDMRVLSADKHELDPGVWLD